MLNISENKIEDDFIKQYSCFDKTLKLRRIRRLFYWLIGFLILFIFFMFLPWTQNISTKGEVTTLRPEHRPQGVYSTISGRIEKWYVREGQEVQHDDTLAFISEVKSEYFDPRLLERTQNQVNAKQAAKEAYEEKGQALSSQMAAMQQNMVLKLEQTANKVKQKRLKMQADSADVQQAELAYTIAVRQFNRTDTLYQQGLKSLTDLEEKRNKMQATQAKVVSAQNKYLTTRNEWLNTKIELGNIRSNYADKMAKVRSEQSTALSSVFDAESQIAKLENTYSNYEQRQNFYYITAPQNGYIVKIHRKGLGEIVKESTILLEIMPSGVELAVSAYVRPMDYPLLRLGQTVRFVFDGWPAFVFSGWPDKSYGTFGGNIVAIDNIANEKGKYRILILPDEQSDWPPGLRVGSGANGLVMLEDVPIWYEFWRQLNGFPPNYYEETKSEKFKLKAPANQLKK